MSLILHSWQHSSPEPSGWNFNHWIHDSLLQEAQRNDLYSAEEEMTKKASQSAWVHEPWTRWGAWPGLGYFLMSQWRWLNYRCELALTISPFSLKSQNLVLELPADKCEWEETSPHFKSDHWGGEPATGLGPAASPHLVFTAQAPICLLSHTAPHW